jgi:hypothetical protein
MKEAYETANHTKYHCLPHLIVPFSILLSELISTAPNRRAVLGETTYSSTQSRLKRTSANDATKLNTSSGSQSALNLIHNIWQLREVKTDPYLMYRHPHATLRFGPRQETVLSLCTTTEYA